MANPSILVVDDDEDLLTMLCVVLSAEGYRAVAAADGAEALQRIRNDGPPALMFVDLMMPRMSGEELVQAITADPTLASIPVAILSGQLTARTPAHGHRVIARLGKPVELDELLTVAHQFADPAV